MSITVNSRQESRLHTIPCTRGLLPNVEAGGGEDSLCAIGHYCLLMIALFPRIRVIRIERSRLRFDIGSSSEAPPTFSPMNVHG
jgi:hypothetical protein